MRKIFLFTLLLLTAVQEGFGAHIIGGEMRYEYIGPGAAPNTNRYKIIMLLFKGDATGGSVAPLAPNYVVGIFNNDNGTKVPGSSTFSDWVITMDVPPGVLPLPISVSSCIANPPVLQYTYASYSMEIDLPQNNDGYTVAFQTCCRQTGMQNVSPTGATYSCVIPGINQLGTVDNDNSPQFQLPVSVICQNSPFNLDFGASDVDGDSLVYSFCNAHNGGRAVDAGFEDPDAPPYQSVGYINPYSGPSPLGPQVSINPQTGMISGISPNVGNYVLCVCINVYRNGRLITVHRKDLMVKVSPCNPIQATPDPGYVTCDGFNIQFDHNSAGANTVFWDFGIDSLTTDTSHIDNPVYVYSDTGIYNVKFVINRGESCADSAFIQMGIYPGFFPDFEAQAPLCTGVPVQFNDSTFTRYGFVDSWRWDFGVATSNADTSTEQHPQFIYNDTGTYTVKLIVTNSKGCEKVISKEVSILPSPVLQLLSNDTLYCGRDSIGLQAIGDGIFSWTPQNRILGANTATPTVFPNTPTTYTVRLNKDGCISSDTVRLHPVFDFENFITASPEEICEEDTLTLTGTANQPDVTWQWSPAPVLTATNTRITRGFPIVTTNFTLTSRWGFNCVSTKQVTVPVTPLAVPRAGPDTAYCLGSNGVQLDASGGTTYRWTPTVGLSDPNIANPVAAPPASMDYVVSVGVDGCPKRRLDTVHVIAREKPALQLTNDTLICIIDTLQLLTTGQGTYQWQPNYMINNRFAANPLVSPDVPTMYSVRLTDIYSCFQDDSVFVDVRPDVTVDAGRDTTICLGDTMRLATSGDAVSYFWQPNNAISNPDLKNPLVWPQADMLYTVRANIGKCEKQSDVWVRVVPYPEAMAWPDTTLCFGRSVGLNASGGSHYVWEPSQFLSSPTIRNPMVMMPSQSTTYTVTVTDTLGCPKPVTHTIHVEVIPPLQVNIPVPDTTIIEGQPLPLSATGALHFAWSPATWLSNPNIRTPVARPEDNMVYTVIGTDQHGCMGRDSIRVTVYTVHPDMYVPTAFTPNGDGNNDVIRPILLGMKHLNYFKVYNRFGEMVFSTTQMGHGWDGVYKGRPQDPATFVWTAEGVTYKGEKITRKGYVVLIR